MKDSVAAKAEMKPTTTEVKAPLKRWHVDVIGPFSTPSATRNRYILVAQDAFSKWPETKAVQSVHKTTKKFPFGVVFGQQPRVPVDGELSLEAPKSTKSREETTRQVEEAIAKDAEVSKRRYDGKRIVAQRNLHGKKVYWQNMQSNPKEGRHLVPRWKGSFLAERTPSRWTWKITDKAGNSKLVNIDQLKECSDSEPLADGFRGRGRPRTVHFVVFYNTERSRGEV